MPPEVEVEVEVDEEVVPVEQPVLHHDDHQEQVVAACAGTAGSAIAAAAAEAKITFFISIPPIRRLLKLKRVGGYAAASLHPRLVKQGACQFCEWHGNA